MKSRRWPWLAVIITALAITTLHLINHPPIALTPYKVWEALPGLVTDSDGRVGRLYRAPHGTVAVVVFNKDKGPRANGLLDRLFLPRPESRSVFMQCTVNLQRLFAGDYKSDEVFRDFLLSRLDGDGWASDGGGVATIKCEGHPNTYILADYHGGPAPEGYTVKFQVQG
jgi:hypothetical protein